MGYRYVTLVSIMTLCTCRQRPKVPPTNKRFLRNTLLSTLPRKKKTDNRTEETAIKFLEGERYKDSNDDKQDEGIKQEIDEKIYEYRRKRAQYYEDEKHHRKQRAEEKKIFNKAHTQAMKQTEREKKKFDSIMRYGVKVGAKRGQAKQENKNAIFDRYHGVWMQLDKTYLRPESNSDDSESSSDENNEDSGSSGHKKYDKYHKDMDFVHYQQHPRGRGYYHHPVGRGREWHSYYAGAHSYYNYNNTQGDFSHGEGGQSGRYHHERGTNYKHGFKRYNDSDNMYLHEHGTDCTYDQRTTKYLDEPERESSDSDRKRHRSKHKKHKKRRKSEKSKKKRKKSSKMQRTTDISDLEGENLLEEIDYASRSSRSKKRKKSKTRVSLESDSESRYSKGDSDQSVTDSQAKYVSDSESYITSQVAEGEETVETDTGSKRDLSDSLSDRKYVRILEDDKTSLAESTSSGDGPVEKAGTKHKHWSKHKKKNKRKR